MRLEGAENVLRHEAVEANIDIAWVAIGACGSVEVRCPIEAGKPVDEIVAMALDELTLANTLFTA